MILDYNKMTPEKLGDSQKGQDSLIQHTFDVVGTTNKFYVEFGAGEWPKLSNTSYLYRECGWSGLLLEGEPSYLTEEAALANMHIERITKDNICDLFARYDVPESPDFVCVDLDGMDYWIIDALLDEYSPRVMMIEANIRFPSTDSFAIKYDEDWIWDGQKWYGASPYAYKKMLNNHGYIPVHMLLDDMFVIRQDVLEESGNIEPNWSDVYPEAHPELYMGHLGRVGNGLVSNAENIIKIVLETCIITEVADDEWEEV